MPPRPRRRKKLEQEVAKQKVRVDTRFKRWTRFFSVGQLGDAFIILEQASTSKMINWKKVDPAIQYMERWIRFHDKFYAPAVAKYLNNVERAGTADEDGMISFFRETARRDAASRKVTARLIQILKRRREVDTN